MGLDPTVAQAKRYGIFSCRPFTQLGSIAQILSEEDISALVVVDEGGYLAGIISRIDLLRANCQTPDWARQPAEAWMSKDVVTVSPRAHLSEVRQILLDRRIHRVVAVQDENGHKLPLAVISAADLVYHMAKEVLLQSE